MRPPRRLRARAVVKLPRSLVGSALRLSRGSRLTVVRPTKLASAGLQPLRKIPTWGSGPPLAVNGGQRRPPAWSASGPG
eukprot:366384-Chlamydomonas_euryale.AAC.7